MIFSLTLLMSWLFPSLPSIICMLLLNTGGMIIIFSQSSAPLQVIVRYVTLQEIGTCLFVLGWVSNLTGLMTVGLLLKLGLPPFHVWLLECSFGVNYESLWSLLTLSKLLPLSLMFSISHWVWGALYVLIGSLVMFHMHSVINLLVVSSWLMIGWMIMCIGSFSVMMGLLVYMLMMSAVITLMTQSEGLIPNPVNWMSIFMLLGLPLSSMFVVKFYLLSEVSLFFNGLMLVIMMMMSVLSMVGYYHIHVLHGQMVKSFSFVHSWQASMAALLSWLFGLILLCLMV